MPEPLRFYQPTTVDAAVGLLADLGEEAKVVAGATALSIDAGRTLVLDGDAVVHAADDAGIAIVARERNEDG